VDAFPGRDFDNEARRLGRRIGRRLARHRP
jgi:hypothetical protein